MPQTIQIVFTPKTVETYNNNLVIIVGSESEKIELKGIGMEEHKKYLQPFTSQLIPEYISELHPQYKNFIDEFFKFIEQKNNTDIFSIEENWSLYNNIMNIFLFNDNMAIPVEHLKLFENMFNDYAKTFNFTNLIIDLNDEKLKKLGLSTNIIKRLSCTWKAYNFYIAAVNEYFITGIKKNVTIKAYYTTYNGTDNPAAYSSLGDDEIILSELPIYNLNVDNTDIEQNSSITSDPNAYKGKTPFYYQLLSKSSLMNNGTFLNNLINNCNPAGFYAEFLYVPPTVRNANCFIGSLSFPKIILNLSTIIAGSYVFKWMDDAQFNYTQDKFNILTDDNNVFSFNRNCIMKLDKDLTVSLVNEITESNVRILDVTKDDTYLYILFYAPGFGTDKMGVVKMDKSFNISATKYFGATPTEDYESIEYYNGNLYITGEDNQSTVNLVSVSLVASDLSLNTNRLIADNTQTFFNYTSYYDSTTHGLLVGGHLSSSGNTPCISEINYTAGSETYYYLTGASGDIKGITADTSGNIYAVGDYGVGAFIIKMNSSKTITKSILTTGQTTGTDVFNDIILYNNVLYVVGESSDLYSSDVGILMKLDTDLNILETKSLRYDNNTHDFKFIKISISSDIFIVVDIDNNGSTGILKHEIGDVSTLTSPEDSNLIIEDESFSVLSNTLSFSTTSVTNSLTTQQLVTDTAPTKNAITLDTDNDYTFG